MENQKVIYGGIVAVLLIVLAIVFWPAPKQEPAPPEFIAEPPIQKLVIPEPVVVEPVPEVLPEPPVLPLAPRVIAAPVSLNESDAKAREAALDLSVQLGRWLVPAEQIRKWVVLVDRAADGELQSKHRPWLVDIGSYVAAGSDDALSSSPQNYRRYDPLITVLDAVAVDKLAYYIEQWLPLFDQAYQELGSAGNFRERALLALDQLISAEALPQESVALVRPSVMYKYADVRLESASDIQKLMWRLGPKNSARVQDIAIQQYRSDF